ncbi:MAG TPA: aldo/keto reductase [Anaeromyxobacteraceae bacterium]|nr:aldo/keto reductase [Anaeromyxobacteraceae bacterium]
MNGLTRRAFLGAAAAAAAAISGAAPRRARAAGPGMRTRPIPRTGEPLPAIGLGTWQTFDVGASEAERAPLAEVLRGFHAAGGRVIDSSPMYGRAEGVVGDLLARVRPASPPFLATKVWTRGRAEGERQARESMRLMRTQVLDLLQVHNLLDWEAHLPAMRAAREAGRVRYLGITHHAVGAMDDMERILRAERLDFVQLPYSVATRAAESRLLPAAAELGVAVLVMRPFEEGSLFRAVRGRALPGWAAEIGCTAWSQVFLKWILGHPAVTAVLPATAKPAHLAENVGAGTGPLPDEALRRRIAKDLDL